MLRLAMLDNDGTFMDTTLSTKLAHIDALSGISSPEEVHVLITNTLGYSPDRQYAILRFAKLHKYDVPYVIQNERRHGLEIAWLRRDKETARLLDIFWSSPRHKDASLFEDTKFGLYELKEAGYELGITTGFTPTITRQQLQSTGITRYFADDLILGYEPPITKDLHVEELKKRRRLTDEELKHVIIIGDGVGEMGLVRKYSMIGYGIDRRGNAMQQLLDAGAQKVFTNLVSCAHYISSSAAPAR